LMTRSGNKDWEFVSRGTEISLGKFVPEYFTPLTLNLQTSVVSTEDTDEIWETAKEIVMEKVSLLAQQTRRVGDKQENEEGFVVLYDY
jgi:hypothetical protein